MIEAARNGLRVDLTKVPESPTLGQSLPASVTAKADFVVVQTGDCTPENSSREETFASLEKALKSQYEVSQPCSALRENFAFFKVLIITLRLYF